MQFAIINDGIRIFESNLRWWGKAHSPFVAAKSMKEAK